MHSLNRLRPALGCALVAALAVPAAASAHSVGASLRVEAARGKSLADVTQYTSPAKIKTDRGAACFGSGTGGSGDRAPIPNKTALGLVADALPNVPSLRPLSLTDHFSFGLGVCGIGGAVGGDPDPFWDLKVNHVTAQVGGDQAKVHDGDRVLWYLAPSFPVGDELALRLPAFARTGQAVQARVTAYDDKGHQSPVAGATVTFASAPTDTSGFTHVTLPPAGTFHVQATLAGDIPSNVEKVCAGPASRKGCGFQRVIFGGPGSDRISATNGSDRIDAGAGNDRITLKLAGADKVNCGPGHDVVVRHRQDDDDRIGHSCEKVIKR